MRLANIIRVASTALTTPALVAAFGDRAQSRSEIRMSLAESARKWVLANLPYDQGDPNIVAALDAMSPRHLLVLYLNWRDRLIAAQPRRVLKSGAFDQNEIVRQRALVIWQIIDDIENGRDLTKYLSRRIKSGFELPPKPGIKKLSRLKHLDLLLNDWGIHHLHISTTIEADGFVERDGPLLFAIFKPHQAYFIDAMGHEDFADDRLIRIVSDAWPNEGLVSEVKGIVGGLKPYRKEDRAALRSAGLFSFIQIDGRVFWSSMGGISSAGTSAKASVMSGRILRTLKQFEDQVQSNPAEIVETMRRHGVDLGGKPNFEFAFFSERIRRR
jgi:hypothetical protein